MRPFYYLPLIAALAACDSGGEVAPAEVQWMQWPAEVLIGTPFKVRMILPFPGCRQHVLRLGVKADQSAVTFAPYFILHEQTYCPPEPLDIVVPNLAIDTTGTAPGLEASTARTFEMRATTSVYVPTPRLGNDLPTRTFGEVTVRPAFPDNSRTNAAGYINLIRDDAGCARITPNAYYNPDIALMLEDQADTVGLNYAFVRGYIYETLTPVCGQSRVFHLLSRN